MLHFWIPLYCVAAFLNFWASFLRGVFSISTHVRKEIRHLMNGMIDMPMPAGSWLTFGSKEGRVLPLGGHLHYPSRRRCLDMAGS
jgi:hypothetical protein